jgi:hypothetical protein
MGITSSGRRYSSYVSSNVGVVTEDDGDMRTRARQLRDGERRAAAVELRGQGWSVNDIALEVGIARSTAWLWTKHIPLDRESERARLKVETGKLTSAAKWEAYRRRRDANRASTAAQAGLVVGALTERDLLLIGAGIYWCEGKKTKPWRPDDCRLLFTNSDVGLTLLFIRYLLVLGIDRSELAYRVSIHDSANAAAAERWWAEQLDLPLSRFKRPTLKRHRPRTNRLNTAAGYHGCLVIDVPKSRELYWRTEGIMAAMRSQSDRPNLTRVDVTP